MTTYAWTAAGYTESTHARIPADVYWFSRMQADRKLKVSDQLPAGHWIKTYGNTFKAAAPAPDFKAMAKIAGAEEALKKFLVKPPSGAGPKILTAKGRSLYDAALRLKNATGPSQSQGEAKALERAMRYYMLATYSLIDTLAVRKAEGSLVNNYVAAMLVSEEGKILSVGMNVGAFMHAEVSMLLSYFINNPAEAKLPANSLVFSTLTPCMQCTKFLMESRAGSTLMYYGQMDKGDFGNIGSLDVAAFKAVVAKQKDYDTSHLAGLPEGEAMMQKALFGKPPQVYNINQGEINDVVKLISERKGRKSPAYDSLTKIDFNVPVKGGELKVSNTAGQLKGKAKAVEVFSGSTTTLAAKGKIAEHKAKEAATADDIAFRAIQKDVLDYLTRSLTEIQFYA